MTPTEELKAEHQAIMRMLRTLTQIAGRLEAGQRVDPQHLVQIVEFLQVFADRCHHGKEEDLLFARMQEAGIPKEGGPIGVMLAEHTVGRGHVRALSEAVASYRAGDPAAAARIAEHARGYAALLTQHIAKEDHVLYPMADRVLAAEVQAALAEGFEAIERERVGPGRHEAFHHLLDELERVYA
jgi:hemerythrin-like domain-containing protein